METNTVSSALPKPGKRSKKSTVKMEVIQGGSGGVEYRDTVRGNRLLLYMG